MVGAGCAAPGGVAALQLLSSMARWEGRRAPPPPAALHNRVSHYHRLASHNTTTPNPRRPRKGGVKLVFEAPDGEELHFERVIKPTGAGAEAFTSEVRQAALARLACLPYSCTRPYLGWHPAV